MTDLREMIGDGLREKFVTKYVRQWLNAEHTAHQVLEVYPDGRERPVSEQQDVYRRWLKAGNEPAEREFVPPPPPPEDRRSPDEKAADEWAAERDLGRVVYDLVQRVTKLEARR